MRKKVVMYKIRKGTPFDQSQIEKIASKAYKKYVDLIGKKPAPMVADFLKHLNEDYVFVIEDTDNSQILGYAVIVLKNNEYWLENIAVYPTKTKQGFGTQLTRYVEDFVSKSASTIQLYTNVKMYENIDWYKRIGYSEIKRITVDGFERVYFIKEL